MSVNFLLIIFVLIVVAMIAFILVQKGSGATAGSAFGSGASNTVFGAKGSGNFLTKTTMILAFLFFAISMLMAINASKEFSTAATGEVDLGVMGKLDTSTSDVPQIGPVTTDDAQIDSDIPAVEVKTDADDNPVLDAVNDAINDVPEVKADASALEQRIEDKAIELKDTAIDKVDELKTEAVEKAKESIDG